MLHKQAHEIKVTPFNAIMNTAWQLLHDYKSNEAAGKSQLPSQMCTNKSINTRLWLSDHIQRDPALGKQGYHQYRYALGHNLLGHPSSPGNEEEAIPVQVDLDAPHPSDSHIPDPQLNMRPTREEIKIQLKKLPSDKAAGPDGISNRILQAGGERAVDKIYKYMLIIWEVQKYSGAWALALMQSIYKGRGKDRHCPSSYRGIYLLNTLTKLFEGPIEYCLPQFTGKHDTLTSAQQGSRTSRQIHDAIYAHIATIQRNKQNGIPSYYCFVDFATAYPSVHRTRLARTLINYKITGKIWHLLKENSRKVRIRVLHALIEAGDKVDILCGLPEGSQLSPTLIGTCAAELIHELRSKFPELKFADITCIDDFNWIGAFLYVNDMVLVTQSATQLQHMIDACQEWSERSSMKINNDNTKIMVSYETLAQRASQHQLLFWLTSRFPLNNSPNPLPLDEPKEFTYLGLKLDPQMTMQPATAHTCQKINWGYQTVSAIAHSLKHDTPASLRGTRTSPLILYRICRSCVLSHATQNLRYLPHPTQV